MSNRAQRRREEKLNRTAMQPKARGRAEGAQPGVSQLRRQEPYPSRERLEGDYHDRGIELCERLDAFAPLRNGLRRVAKDRDDWAGIPMPIDDHELIIEPTYHKGAELGKIGLTAEQLDRREMPEGVTFRNRWYSARRRAEIYLWEEGGKVHWGAAPVNRATMDVNTLDVSVAWGIEQEGNAVHTLGELVRHWQFKQYLLTGMFVEVSLRSRLTYIFRKLRPTIVLNTRGQYIRIIGALCMHPIGYYSESWAGAMCPTDDVIAHLMLMRADEHMFWRRCNQHSVHNPAAAL